MGESQENITYNLRETSEENTELNRIDPKKLSEAKIAEGAWCSNGESKDISYNWVAKMEDIQQIEQGIHVLEFAEKQAKRNPDMEFRLIRRITETQFHNEELKDYEPKLNKMNRYNNILPYKRTEVKLLDSDEEEGYINASYINAIHIGVGDKKFIATQGPLPETLEHFWKMIWNEEVQCIVMLCNLKENEKIQCEQYWPASTETTQSYGKFKVIFKEEIKQDQLYKRRFSVSKEGVENESRTVWQYQWSEWRDHSVPEAAGQAIIEELVEIMITEYTHNRTSVIHCSAGVGRTGTLISLVNLVLNLRHYLPKLEQAVKDGVTNYQKCDALKDCTLSVFGVVRRLREQRWGMVHHAEQYRYLYKYMKQLIEQELNKINATQLLVDVNSNRDQFSIFSN